MIEGIKLIKCDKTSAKTLIVGEILKASRAVRAQDTRDLIEDIIHFEKIPTEWEESIIISLEKGKGVALARGNYRGLRLLDQVTKLLDRVAKNFLW